MDDAIGQLYETATYCKPNDDKRPGLVGTPDFSSLQICPDDGSAVTDAVTDAYPPGWYVRIMFDELLKPDIEDLIEIDDENGQPTGTYEGSIANTHPVKLECESVNGGMIEVDYDGYYSPSGNAVTWPLGPSLVIKPNDPSLIATQSHCQVTINDNVVDKDGNMVPSDQRGPFKFQIAPIQVVTIDPSDESEVDAEQIYYDNVYVQFNTAVDPDSLCTDADVDGLCDGDQPTSFTFSPDVGGYCSLGGNPCAANSDCTAGAGDTCEKLYAYSLEPYGFTDQEFGFGPINPVETGKAYTFSFLEGQTIKDRCGAATTLGTPSVDDQTLINFTTADFDLNDLSPFDGEHTSSAMKKPTLTFNNVIDPGSLDLTEFTLTPAPTIPASTDTCTAGNEATDCTSGYGAECVSGFCVYHVTSDGSGAVARLRGYYAMNTEYTFTLKANATVTDAYGVTYTNPTDQVVHFTTPAQIEISSSTPKDNATLQTVGGTTAIGFSFNQAMNAATFDSNDYTIAPMTGVTLANGGAAVALSSSSSCSASASGCTLYIAGSFPAGTYTFTLKQGATVDDQLGNTYTQAADKVIHFTVTDPDPPKPACL